MIPQNVAPVLVMNTQTRRETGRKAQIANIQAAKVPKNLFYLLGYW
jgi:hypothetical protein